MIRQRLLDSIESESKILGELTAGEVESPVFGYTNVFGVRKAIESNGTQEVQRLHIDRWKDPEREMSVLSKFFHAFSEISEARSTVIIKRDEKTKIIGLERSSQIKFKHEINHKKIRNQPTISGRPDRHSVLKLVKLARELRCARKVVETTKSKPQKAEVYV